MPNLHWQHCIQHPWQFQSNTYMQWSSHHCPSFAHQPGAVTFNFFFFDYLPFYPLAKYCCLYPPHPTHICLFVPWEALLPMVTCNNVIIYCMLTNQKFHHHYQNLNIYLLAKKYVFQRLHICQFENHYASGSSLSSKWKIWILSPPQFSGLRFTILPYKKVF